MSDAVLAIGTRKGLSPARKTGGDPAADALAVRAAVLQPMAKSVMMVVFVLPSSLRRWVSGKSEVKVFAVGADHDSPPTLGSALDMLRRTHPLLEERLRDDYGRIRRHINMIVCGENARGVGGLDCALPPGAEVYVMPALA